MKRRLIGYNFPRIKKGFPNPKFNFQKVQGFGSRDGKKGKQDEDLESCSQSIEEAKEIR